MTNSSLIKILDTELIIKVNGYKCGGVDYFGDFDCSYAPKFTCDECVFVVGKHSNDYRKGKRPWSKQNENV